MVKQALTFVLAIPWLILAHTSFLFYMVFNSCYTTYSLHKAIKILVSSNHHVSAILFNHALQLLQTTPRVLFKVINAGQSCSDTGLSNSNITGLLNFSNYNSRLHAALSLVTLKRFSLFAYRRNSSSHSSTPGVSGNFSKELNSIVAKFLHSLIASLIQHSTRCFKSRLNDFWFEIFRPRPH